MPWTNMVVAFLAGYGLMSLVLWGLATLGWLRGRPCTTSALVLAGDEEHRLEGILRSLHQLWGEGRLTEILVQVNGHEATRELARRLLDVLPGISLIPGDAGLGQAVRAAAGETVWLIDLAKIPERTTFVGQPWRRSARGRRGSRGLAG